MAVNKVCDVDQIDRKDGRRGTRREGLTTGGCSPFTEGRAGVDAKVFTLVIFWCLPLREMRG